MVAKMLLGDEVEGPTVPVRLQLRAPRRPRPPGSRNCFRGSSRPRCRARRSTSCTPRRKPSSTVRLDKRPTCRTGILPGGAWRVRVAPPIRHRRSRWMTSPKAGLAGLVPDDQSVDDAAVYITTIHQARGMEFDNVALLEARAREDEEPPRGSTRRRRRPMSVSWR